MCERPKYSLVWAEGRAYLFEMYEITLILTVLAVMLSP